MHTNLGICGNTNRSNNKLIKFYPADNVMYIVQFNSWSKKAMPKF